MNASGFNYKFTGCQEQNIPDGIHEVAELDLVGVYLPDNKVIHLSNPEFQSLIAHGKAVRM
ncbi:hypothetical protein [Stenotrophomonas maltophilia]|uniref:hypothetical protein n=1 Tax=Stenotrophomonas maltophilia TaxID=40324 RepID=UPI0021159782|nr:hypothetical protein [Stenotrophomonas maltophilia]